MFRKITDIMEFPDWAGKDSRWRRLDIYDKLLDGTFYDHLPYAFYDEVEVGTGNRIPLERRRPSAQYRLPRYIARWAARKLFAGRHIPKVRSRDKSDEEKITKLLSSIRLWPTMFEAAYRGSVGSVAVTFRVDEDKVGLKVWRAVWCSPVFDDFGNLTQLRVHYCTSGAALRSIGLSVAETNKNYWFIRDYNLNEEITYQPILDNEWNPVKGFREPEQELLPVVTIQHNLGFVPGVWIANPGGTQPPDGQSLWEDAIPNTIELDYILSQAARGARYNCAPQLVTQGRIINLDGNSNLTRSPIDYLAFAAAERGENGATIGGGDAKLLEMTGKGTEAALAIAEILKKYALEQVGVVQKDPGELPGPLSGRAMEYLDQDAHDTAMQWRSTYGEGGAVPLLAKILRVLDPDIDVKGLWLQWPRIYQPTPGDLQSIAQALEIISKPSAVPGAKPDPEDGSVPTLAPLLDPETASAYLKANLDLGIIEDDDGGGGIRPSGDVPNANESADKDGVMGVNGPFWRVYPPIRVGNKVGP